MVLSIMYSCLSIIWVITLYGVGLLLRCLDDIKDYAMKNYLRILLTLGTTWFISNGIIILIQPYVHGLVQPINNKTIVIFVIMLIIAAIVIILLNELLEKRVARWINNIKD